MPKAESITWTGTVTAGSFPSVTFAIWTGPQSDEPSPKWTHSARKPEPEVTCVREPETLPRAVLKILSPKLPVSSKMPLIVTQFDVLVGLQTVTLTHGSFVYGVKGDEDELHVEPLTVKESTLSAVPVTVSPVEPAILPEVAVMVVAPSDTNEAFPLEPAALLIVATDTFDELQVTDEVIFGVVPSE